jgi:protein-disulfide isomerase
MPLSIRISRLLPAVVGIVALFAFGVPVFAQFSNPTHVTDASVLKPPPGARVALFEFEDLECPDCARAAPLLKEATEKYKIPLVRHDFPLPFHIWSFDAAVNARWFDTKSRKIGDDFRDAVFAAQRNIHNQDDLHQFTQKFAADHGIALPFVIDPQKKLADGVKADFALGQRVGIEHTPTIWVVTNGVHASPFVEVVDRTKLFEMLDQALADTKGK